MRISRRTLAALALVGLAVIPAARLAAQGVTTGAIGGTVTDPAGKIVEAVQIQVVNTQTGFTTGTITRANGTYLVQNLEVGGPYTVRARRIGFEPAERTGVFVGLSQTFKVDLQLQAATVQLNTVVVQASPFEMSPTNQGTKTTISDTVIQRLPTLSRNLTDFIRLTPQVSASGPGFSGGGMSNRMNNVQIDGATERDVFGLGSTGQPGGQVSARAISLEAVKEFQVLLAPFDVRQGNFGGLLLNAVTKSGTNDFTGSAFYFYRNQDYGRNVPALRATQFDRTQAGFSLGGPLIKNKLHFFTANEFQRENTPVTGPFFGQPTTSSPAFPIAADSLTRLQNILQGAPYNFSPGSVGALNAPQPMTNLFGRLDYQLNDVHRLVFRYNYTNTVKENRTQTGRGATTAVYSSNLHELSHKKNAPVLQLFSNFKNGASNELFLGADLVQDRRAPPTKFPQITINNISGSGNRVLFGADESSQGNELDAYTYELTNNFTYPKGSHTFVIGTRNEFVDLRNLFAQASYGVWTFQNMDSLAAGNPNTFRKAFILSQGGNAYFDALLNALYVQDQWQATSRFTLTYGLRADMSTFTQDNDYALAIDSAYGARETPKRALQWSPRVGFNWDISGNQVNQLRGGAGYFVGTPPYVWLENAYINNGRIISNLSCTTGSTGNPAPAFQVDASNIATCRNGAGSRPIGNVNFLDKNLKFPQPLRANIAFDRLLPGNIVATVEGLLSKNTNQFFFINEQLAGPQSLDAQGRVLYGTIAASGVSSVRIRPSVIANGGTARFTQAIGIENQNKDFSYNLTGQLKKRYSNNWEAQVAYTYSRARDVQSFTSSTHGSNWQFGRTYAGRQEDAYTTVSLFDQPHKIQAIGTYTLNWLKNFSTDFTLDYQGVSGPPHDYIYGGSSGRGDLNADGSQGNDLIYVPLDARDPTQLRFQNANFTVNGVSTAVTAADQAAAFEQFIRSSECLSDHRGQILPRNSCRQPMVHQLNLAIRQSIPSIMGQRLSVQFEVNNLGNLLNSEWGQQRVTPQSGNSNVPLVTHVAQSGSDATVAVPVVTFNPFTFDPNFKKNSAAASATRPNEYQPGTFASNYWRTQLSVRYSF